jgi:L-ribulose-5-phosphate 3-epimerase UlaE
MIAANWGRTIKISQFEVYYEKQNHLRSLKFEENTKQEFT